MKNTKRFIILITILFLITGCNTFYNDDSLSEYYDYGHSTINVLYRIKHNEEKGIPFVLNKQKSERMKNEHGTQYIYTAKDGSNITISAVYKIFNEPDQSYYYILEDENENPIANVKLLTNKKGKVIDVEVVNGK